MSRLELSESWALPLTEVSALALRPAGASRELVAVSDEQFDVLAVPAGDDGALGDVDVHDLALTLSPEVIAATDGAEFEGVACDGSGRVFLLQEGPARILVIGPGWSGLERIIALVVDPSEPVFGAEWNGSGEDARNRRGEGLLLLANGHLLVIKQRDPVCFIEFGPAGATPAGLGPEAYLPPDAPFELPGDGDLDYGVLAASPLSDQGAAGEFPALNDVAVGDDGRLYVISSKAAAIGQVEAAVRPREDAVSFDAAWDLPDDLPGGDDGKPEGLVMLSGGSPLISIDTKAPDDNLVRFAPIS